jgi:hypothetical protein
VLEPPQAANANAAPIAGASAHAKARRRAGWADETVSEPP